MQVGELARQNQALAAHLAEVEAHKGQLAAQVAALRERWQGAAAENLRLTSELAALRKVLQVRSSTSVVQSKTWRVLSTRGWAPHQQACHPAQGGAGAEAWYKFLVESLNFLTSKDGASSVSSPRCARRCWQASVNSQRSMIGFALPAIQRCWLGVFISTTQIELGLE